MDRCVRHSGRGGSGLDGVHVMVRAGILELRVGIGRLRPGGGESRFGLAGGDAQKAGGIEAPTSGDGCEVTDPFGCRRPVWHRSERA